MHRTNSERLGAVLLAVTTIVTAQVFANDWGWKEGRRNIVQITKGKVGEAIQKLETRLAKQPKHGEVLFALAICAAQEEREEAALEYVRRALDAGLPVERFFAGPREMTRPIVAAPAFAKLLAARNIAVSNLLHGPLLGDVTDSSARFWARTRIEANLQVEIKPAAGDEESVVIVSPVARTSKTRDFTAVTSVEGLRPDTAYLYRLRVDGTATGKWTPMRTFPKRDLSAKFDLVFGGGAAFTPEYERVFTTIAAQKPLAFLQLGDNVYIAQADERAVQRYCYYRRQSSAPYRTLTASTPVFAIWDDHDFSNDDCWGGPEIDTPNWKRPVWEVFRQNWNNPGYGGGEKQPGVWFDTRIADVHFVFLDCRYYRMGPKVPAESRSMLGPVQKKWLLETLAASKATFKIIVTSVPFALGVKPGSKDPWDGFPAEREEIFSFIGARKIMGVVLVSADRHRSDLWKIERPNAYDLYEFQSSRLTNIHKHPVMRGSIWGYNEDRSFGVLRFDTRAADPQVTYDVLTVDGEKVRTFTLKLSSLQF